MTNVTERMAGPRPVVDCDSKPFWDAAARGELLLQVCAACQRWQFPPRAQCARCAADVTWRAASGTATLYSYTVVHRAPAGFADAVPYAVGLGDLIEGVRMVAVVDAPLDSITIGQALQVAFARRGDDFVLPVFRPKPGRPDDARDLTPISATQQEPLSRRG